MASFIKKPTSFDMTRRGFLTVGMVRCGATSVGAGMHGMRTPQLYIFSS